MSPRAAALACAAVLATAVLVAGAPAHADTTAQGSGGQRLTVSKSTGLDRAGETVTVSGAGYDVNKGIYVAFCVDKGAGKLPTPCGGGADTTGSLGASHWISSNPPSYGEGLAVPYGAGGSFRVRIKVTMTIGDTDCTKFRCVVVTRNDHTRSADRSQDVRVLVRFAATGTPTKTTPAPTRTTTAAPAPSPTTVPPTTMAVPTPSTVAASATPAPASTGTPLAVIPVSESSTAGRWWTVTIAALGAGLVVFLGVGAWRRRARR
ncbi:hypothetical protein WEI85_32555 [Actinomycetes bacterium KLBMP 9797]